MALQPGLMLVLDQQEMSGVEGMLDGLAMDNAAHSWVLCWNNARQVG